MPTMNVSLPRALVDYVESEVASGEYGTASEVVRDALRLLRHERAAREEKLVILRREIAIGMAQADAGLFAEETMEEIEASIDAEESRTR